MGARDRRRWCVLSGLGLSAAILLAAWYVGFPGSPSLPPIEAARRAYVNRDWQVSWELSRTWLREHPDDRDALRLWARSSARLGRRETAARLFARLGEQAFEAEDYLVIGLIQRDESDRSMALSVLRTALATDPTLAEARDELASLLLAQGSPAEAEAVVQPLLDLDGWQTRGAWRFGRALSARRDSSRAAEVLGLAARRDPDFRASGLTPSETRQLLARVFLAAGRPEDARAALGEAANDPEALWLLGRAALQQGKADEVARLTLRARDAGAAEEPSVEEPAPYVGASRCNACHQAKYRSQQSSRHARTITRGPAVLAYPIPSGVVPDPHHPRIRHTFAVEGDRFQVGVRDEEDGRAIRGFVEYILGSGDRGATSRAAPVSSGCRPTRAWDGT